MDSRLKRVFENRYGNCLMPFYWQQGNHSERIPQQMEMIRSSGCGAVCVESRTHDRFGQREWFDDLRLILEQAERLDMKVWILDDDHFPTGHAAGLVAQHPELRKLSLAERHVDVVGPMREAAVLINRYEADDELLGAFMYERMPDSEQVRCERCIELTDRVQGDFIYFDIPDGFWRVFLIFKTHHGANEHIDMLNPHSVELMFRGVYEPHYRELSQYFGGALAGFFSDEPGFYSDYFMRGVATPDWYSGGVGTLGLLMPISNEVLSRMDAALGYAAAPYLIGLWYDIGQRTAPLRHSYMNAITALYSECFSQRVGDWCHSHGVQYIGHIIEDNNAHSHISCSTGHYFRSQRGQDMSGMDVVFNQLMPGFADYSVGSFAAGSCLDNNFFHYMLAKMCASDAHFDPKKRGRAMCEVFGAGGWGEGTQTQKWLIDHLLVRGINHFVPHAFSPSFPNDDCPPHFNAEGNDPQFEGFTALMNYTNKMSCLLSGGLHIAEALVLYDAEGQWCGEQNWQPNGKTQSICRELYDSHIDFDIVSLDHLRQGSVSSKRGSRGEFQLCGESFRLLFVPYAPHWASEDLHTLQQLARDGLQVVFVGGEPLQSTAGDFDGFYAIAAGGCAQCVNRLLGQRDIVVSGEAQLLRHYHIKRGGADIYMFFNESVQQTARATVQLARRGEYLRLDLLGDASAAGVCESGELSVSLAPYQSAVYVFDDFEPEFYATFPPERQLELVCEPDIDFSISVSRSGQPGGFEPLMRARAAALPNITGATLLPDFSGYIRYSGRLRICGEGSYALELGEVGQNARLWVNGRDAGIRICKPFVFDLSALLHEGENDIEIVVANTLVQRMRDEFSSFSQIPPSGLLGPLRLLRIEHRA